MTENKNHIKTGFTTVELVVALFVSALVLTSVYELFKAVSLVSEKQNKSTSASQQVIYALDQIRCDLTHSIGFAPKDGFVFAGQNIPDDFEEFKLMEFYSLSLSDCLDNVTGIRRPHRIKYNVVRENGSVNLFRTSSPIIGDRQISNCQSSKVICNEYRFS